MATTEYDLTDLANFSRASVKQVFDVDNVLVEVPSSEAAFSYNGLNGGGLGILLEPEVEQSLPTPDDPVAVYTGGTGTTWGATSTGPDGTATYHKLVATAVNASHFLSRTHTEPANQDLSLSLWFKPGEYGRIRLRLTNHQATGDWIEGLFNVTAGTVTPGAAGTGVVSRVAIETYAGGKTRLIVTGKPSTAASTQTDIRILMENASGLTTFTGNDSDGVHIGPSNLTTGNQATSHINDTSTREGDTLSATALTTWFNAAQSTMYAKVMLRHPAPTGKDQVIACFRDGPGDNMVKLYNAGGGTSIKGLIKSGGVTVFDETLGSFTPAVQFKVVLGFNTNFFGGSMNGATALTEVSGAVPTAIDEWNWGADDSIGSNCLNGTLIDFESIPWCLSDDDMALKSAL